MLTIKLDDSLAGSHIDNACRLAIEKLSTYGNQDVEVAFDFNGTIATARHGDTVDSIRQRWETDIEAAYKAYRDSDEYKKREAREAEELERKKNAVMKETASGEGEMRDAKVPSPYTMKQLTDYVESLTTRQHDYGTCVYAMSMGAVAAFNYVAHQLGVTGFQSSCADLDFLRRTRSIKGPFMLAKLEDALYPQYDLHSKLSAFIAESQPWLKEEATKRLAEQEHAHPNVIAHWKKLANLA